VLDLRMLGLRSIHVGVVDLEEHMSYLRLQHWIPLEESIRPCTVEHMPWDSCLIDTLTLELDMCHLRFGALYMLNQLVIS
jgi:hypothetical protein